jgi:hypothetical protein
VRRTTLRKLIAIAAAFAVGLGLGAGGVWALGGTQQGGDTPATLTSYEVVRNDLGHLEIRFWVTTGSNPIFTLCTSRRTPTEWLFPSVSGGRPNLTRWKGCSPVCHGH